MPTPTRTTSSFTLDPELIKREPYKAHLRRAINTAASTDVGSLDFFHRPSLRLHLCARIYTVSFHASASVTSVQFYHRYHCYPVMRLTRDFHGRSSLSRLSPPASPPRMIFQGDTSIILLFPHVMPRFRFIEIIKCFFAVA